jgi:hypothetical protein
MDDETPASEAKPVAMAESQLPNVRGLITTNDGAYLVGFAGEQS